MGDERERYALFDGARWRYEARYESLDGVQPSIVVCVDVRGAARYVSEAAWSQGEAAFLEPLGQPGLVTTISPKEQKLALFKSLFKGRSDIHAHGYFSRKLGKIGYAPACENEWVQGICAKPKVRCAQCDCRKFANLTDEILVKHMQGHRSDFTDVVGVYPMDESCKVHFLVADFDGEGWKREVTAYARTARQEGLFVAVERSRSGDGAHAWIFFEESVDASLARDLGAAIITLSMRERGISFQAYDRLIPAQSTIPEGGFGNLIALPFQGRAQREGNSVFVDDDFIAYPDQWRFLSSVQKTAIKQVKRVLARAGGALGVLADIDAMAHAPNGREGSADESFAKKSNEGAPSVAKPWRRRKKRPDLTLIDFPQEIRVTRSNMLYVSTEGMSRAAIDAVRRLAAFANPEFYKAQSMHISTRGKPRVLYMGQDFEGHIALPRGCDEALTNLLATAGVEAVYDDERCFGRSICVEFCGELRDNQRVAVQSLLEHETGVLEAATGFGKTVTAANLIATRKVNTLVLVHSTALQKQWRDSLEKFLLINEEPPVRYTKTGRVSKKKQNVIGSIGAGENAPSGIVDIALVQSLFENGEIQGEKRIKELVERYGMVICDECHHAPAMRFESVLRAVRARFVYGLTATPRRKDGLEGIIFMCCGPVRYRVTSEQQSAGQTFRRKLIPRFSGARIDETDGSDFVKIVELLCMCESRNAMIVSDACELLRNGRTPLVLTRRVAHAALLADAISASGHRVFLLVGSDSKKDKQDKMDALRAVAQDEDFVIIATGEYVGEGFDEKRLDALLLAAPVSGDGVRLEQYVGRLHRECEGKEDVLVLDYVDVNVPMLDRMYRRRLRLYRRMAYQVTSGDGFAKQKLDALYAVANYEEKFRQDIESAMRRVVVSCRRVALGRIKRLEDGIAQAVSQGADVVVYAVQMSADAASALRKLGSEVIIDKGVEADCAIIDGRTVWYGAISLLGFSRSDAYSLRVQSVDAAASLASALGVG